MQGVSRLVSQVTPLFLGHILTQQAVLLRGEQAKRQISFFEKKLEILLFDQGQDQVQTQPGFQAQPGLQQVQVQVLRGYSTFWPENHFTW